MAVADNAPIAGAPPASEGLFVRQSSGLVREVGTRDFLGIGVGTLLVVAVYSLGAIFLASYPNGDFYIPIIVGGVAALILAFTYSQLVSTFPRSGGEYIYASRICFTGHRCRGRRLTCSLR